MPLIVNKNNIYEIISYFIILVIIALNIQYTDTLSLIVSSIHLPSFLTDKWNKVDNYSHGRINRSRRRSFEVEKYTTKVTMEPYIDIIKKNITRGG